MKVAGRATLRTLDRFECAAMLSMHHVGRLAFHLNDRVDIEPVHYVWADGWVYGRAASGAKLQSLPYSPWVAFEVDDSTEHFACRSVVLIQLKRILLAKASSPTGSTPKAKAKSNLLPAIKPRKDGQRTVA